MTAGVSTTENILHVKNRNLETRSTSNKRLASYRCRLLTE